MCNHFKRGYTANLKKESAFHEGTFFFAFIL